MAYTRFLVIFTVVYNLLALAEMAWYRRGKERGELRFPAVFPLFVAYYVLGMAAALGEHFLSPSTPSLPVLALGCFALAARTLLKFSAARALGRYWSVHIEVRPGQQLVTVGPFRFLRHPGYLSTVFETLVVPLFANAPWTAATVLLTYPALIALRARLEEQALLEHLGDEYRAYQQRSWEFIPYVY